MLNNKEFYIIVKDILNHDKFLLLKSEKHHRLNRYDHCLRVAFKTYKLTKKFNLDSIEVTRAALLHDFFLKEDLKHPGISMFIHPKVAVNNAKEYFDISDKQKNIIESHMFPFYYRLPKYKESLIVDYADDIISIQEVYQQAKESVAKMGYKVKENIAFAVIFILFSLK